MRIQPVFIFDTEILDLLEDKTDHRVSLIYDWLVELRQEYQALGGDLWVFHGKPLEIFKFLKEKTGFTGLLTNHDYEPTARQRDEEVRDFCLAQGIHFQSFKDQVIFEKSEVVTGERNPYTVYTPYKKKWLSQFQAQKIWQKPQELGSALLKRSGGLFSSKTQRLEKTWCSLEEIGFQRSAIRLPDFDLSHQLIANYEKTRDFPAVRGTSQLGAALRFGKVSVREIANLAAEKNETWLSELIWREFFMQILYHFPQVVRSSFRPQYEKVAWRKSKTDFDRWAEGQTGYPLVDAGIRELNQTGYMHNRVRMVVGSFLTKHLLIHWYHGERYFARKLFDFDLSASNGNWQWVAGTGCDAAPYFRIFNPEAQAKKFDPQLEYIKKWVPEFESARYPKPMVDHAMARERALSAFKMALK